MIFERPKHRFSTRLDITPLIDVVFLLLVFLLLTMTFSEKIADVEEAIIDIELAKSSTVQDPTPTEAVTLLIDEKGGLYLSDEPVPKTREQLRLHLSEQLLKSPKLSVNVKADHRARHGQVIDALDLLKDIGIQQVHLVIEKQKQ